MSILGRGKRHEMFRGAPRSWYGGGAQAGNLARILLALDGKLIWQVFGERLPHTCHTCTGVAHGRDEPTYAKPVLAQAPLVNRSLNRWPLTSRGVTQADRQYIGGGNGQHRRGPTGGNSGSGGGGGGGPAWSGPLAAAGPYVAEWWLRWLSVVSGI